MCKSHFKEHKRKTTPIPAVQTSSHVVPTAEGASVYDEILPKSVTFIPQDSETRGKMPLVEHLAEGFQTGKPPAWHRNEERKARGLMPIQNPATQLEGWERELVWMEILMLTGVPDVSFRHLARAWGRDKGFHMVLAQFICERHGDVERKKRKREEEQVAAIEKVVGSMASPPARPPAATGAAAATDASGQPPAKVQALQQLGQSQPSRKLVVTKAELTEFRAAMMTPAPDRKKKIATLLRRRSSGSMDNDAPLPDGIQEQIDALIGADVWDETCYGDSNYNEELAADLFNLAAEDSAILAKRMQNVANARADDDSSTAYSRSEASTKQMLPPAAANKDAPGHYHLPKRESNASLYSSTSSNAQIPKTVAVNEGSEMEGGDTLGPSFATDEIGRSPSFPQAQQHSSGEPAQGFQQPPPHAVQNQDVSGSQQPQVPFQSTFNAGHQHNTSQTMQNDTVSHHHQAQQQPPQYGEQNQQRSGTSDFSQILPQVQHRRHLSEPPLQGRSPHRRHLSEPPQQWGVGQIPPAVGHQRQLSYQGLPAIGQNNAHIVPTSQPASVGHPLLAQNKPHEGQDQAVVHGRLRRQNSQQGRHQRHHSQQGLALLANNAMSTMQDSHGHPLLAPAPVVQRHQRNHSLQGFQLHGLPHPQNHQIHQQGHNPSISQHQGRVPAHSGTPPQSLHYRQHSQGHPLHGQPLATPGEHVQQQHPETTANATPTHQVQQANFAQAGGQVLPQPQSQNPHAQPPREHSHYEYDHERTEHLCPQDDSDSDPTHGDRDHGCEEIEEHHDHTDVHQGSQQVHQVTQVAQASSEHSWNSFAAQNTASQGPQQQQVHQVHQTAHYQQINTSSQPSVQQTQAVAQHYDQVTPAPQGQQEQYLGHQQPSHDPAHSWNQPGGQAGAGQHGQSSGFSHDQHANQHNIGNPYSQNQAPQMQPFGKQGHPHGQNMAQQGFSVQNQPAGVPGYGQGESHGHFQGQQQEVTQDAYQIHPPNHGPNHHFDHEASSSNYGQGQHHGQALHHEASQQGQHVADHPQDVSTGYFQQEQGRHDQHQSGQPLQQDQPVYEPHSNQEQDTGVNSHPGPHQGQDSNHEQSHHQTGQSYEDALFELPYTSGAAAGSETEEQFDHHHPSNSFQDEHQNGNGAALGNSEVTTHSWEQQGHEQPQIQHDPTQAQQQHQQENGQGHQDGQQTHHVFIEEHLGYPPESQNQHLYAEQQPQHGYGDHHQQEGANFHQESQQQQSHVSYVDERNFVTVNGQQTEGYYDPSDNGAHQGSSENTVQS